MFNRDDDGHISYLDEYLMQRQTIQRDNELKEYCLDRLQEMCVKAGVDVARLEPNYRDGSLVSVTIDRYFQPCNQTINVEGDAPITMLKELIIKGKLG